MKELVKVLSDYNTFIIDNKLALGMGVDIPCYTGNSEQITRFYPGQPVFILDAVTRFAPFVGYKSVEWTKTDDIVHVTVQYEDSESGDLYDVEYNIKCIDDVSRCDNINQCALDIIDINELKKPKYVDADQSRYIDNKKYYVTDLFRLGTLNKKQRLQLESLFKQANNNNLHSTSATIYYTDDGEWGLWDYLKAKPVNKVN